MVVGFNHNVMYRGEMFHVQTEDSGINNPHIITLLYRGGTIITSKKTSYADILKMENLGQVVEELMKEQHKDALRRLKSGEFDVRAFPPADVTYPVIKDTVKTVSPPEPVPVAPVEQPIVIIAEPSIQPAPSIPSTPSPEEVKPAKSLDEIILNYLVAGDD